MLWLFSHYFLDFFELIEPSKLFLEGSIDLSSAIEREGIGLTGKIKPILNQGSRYFPSSAIILT